MAKVAEATAALLLAEVRAIPALTVRRCRLNR